VGESAPEDEPAAAEAALAPPAEDAPFPWELPEEAASAGAPRAPEEEEAFSFESLLAEPEPEREAEPETPPVSGPPPAESAAPASAEPAAAHDEEEDDLESFQAWLRSLKR
jgi:hypothetical protein